MAVQSLAFRVAAPSSGHQPPGLDVFGTDMPRPVPLQRWDADDARLAGNSARFGGFIEGAHWGVVEQDPDGSVVPAPSTQAHRTVG